jgi:hypothetical protein
MLSSLENSMNKRFLLFILMANSCSAAADDRTAEFFRVADQGEGATKVIVSYLRHISRMPGIRTKMDFVAQQPGYHIDSSINMSMQWARDEDVDELSGTVRVINNGQVEELRVESKLIAAQRAYNACLQSDAFTVSSVFGNLRQCGVVGVECTTIVPKAAYLRIIREGEAAAARVEDAKAAE